MATCQQQLLYLLTLPLLIDDCLKVRWLAPLSYNSQHYFDYEQDEDSVITHHYAAAPLALPEVIFDFNNKPNEDSVITECTTTDLVEQP